MKRVHSGKKTDKDMTKNKAQMPAGNPVPKNPGSTKGKQTAKTNSQTAKPSNVVQSTNRAKHGKAVKTSSTVKPTKKTAAKAAAKETPEKTKAKAHGVPKKASSPTLAVTTDKVAKEVKPTTAKTSATVTPPAALSPNELVLRTRTMVDAIAYSLLSDVPPEVERSDLISEGYVGLVQAAQKFDVSKGVKFETFAYRRIYGAMCDFLRGLDILPRTAREKMKLIESAERQVSRDKGAPADRTEVATKLGISINELEATRARLSVRESSIESLGHRGGGRGRRGSGDGAMETGALDLPQTSAVDPLDGIHASRLMASLRADIETMSEREKLVLALIGYEGMPLGEISEVLGYSLSTVRQVREKLARGLQERIQRALAGTAVTAA